MSALLDVTLPVFLVIGFGYLSVWRGWFSEGQTDALMKFAQGFAIPCLLFKAVAGLDLSASFNPNLLATFYTGSAISFLAGYFGARHLFQRTAEDAVAIGFCCLFANSVLLGLPITERAYGADAMAPNYVIVSVHAPFAYIIGITCMEMIRHKGEGLRDTSMIVLKAIFSNALMIGILLGFFVNLTGLTLPAFISDAVDLMVVAALPAALFGLGGVLVRYQPEGDMRTILFVCTVSLLLHPLIALALAGPLKLSEGELRSAVLTASMAPGVNSFLFASMYGRALRVVASSVLIGTALSILSVSIWLIVLA